MRSKLSHWLLSAALLAVTAMPSFAAQGYLGVTTQEITPDMAAGRDLTRNGLLVTQVEDDSPADRAGLRRGDVILSYNSRNVSEPSALRQLVRQTESDRTVSLSIWRDGARKGIEVKLGEVPDNDDFIDVPSPPVAPRAPRAPVSPRAPRRVEIQNDSKDGDSPRRVIINGKEIPEDEIDETLKDMDIKVFGDDGSFDSKSLKGLAKLKGMEGMPGFGGGQMYFAPSPNSRGRLGVRVDKLSDEMRDALGAKDDEGVLVLEVMGDTPAQRAGVRAGDIILKIDDSSVDSPDALVRSLRGHDGKVQLHVFRKGMTKSLEANLDADSSEGDVRVRVAPRLKAYDRYPEPGQGGRGYRNHTRSAPDDSDLRDEINELKRELRELREQLREKK